MGVTLVELAVVISVISVLALIAAPRLMDFKHSVSANEAARQITSDMQLARSRAIFENREFRITFNEPSTGSYRMRSRAAGDSTDWASATIELSSQSLPGGVEFKATVVNGPSGAEVAADGIDFTDNAVTFKNTGAADPAGTVYMMPTRDIAEERTDRIRAVMVKFAQTAKIKAYKYDANDGWINF